MAGFRSMFNASGHWQRPFVVIAALLLILGIMALVAWRSGWWDTSDQDQAEQQEEKAKPAAKEKEEEERPDLETGKLRSLPHGSNPDLCPYKPGHWMIGTLPARANNFDLLGDLEMTVVEGGGKPMALLGTPYWSTGSREITLSKGRIKSLEAVLYVPATGRNAGASAAITVRKPVRLIHRASPPLHRMPSHQYHFVVLARRPANYKFLETLDSVKDPAELESDSAGRGYYRIQLMQADKQAALPRHALFWTSIAYILWDDAAPDALRWEQPTALIDWLHWGGQMIISGPDSLDGLRNSFLAPYLPALSAGTCKLSPADFDPLNDWWTGTDPKRQRLVPIEPWTGVRLEPTGPEARAVPGTGGLLVERRVGRGRIVVSAFELNEPELISWAGFDAFFNGCLLNRPPRVFFEPKDRYSLSLQVTWYDRKANRTDKGAQLDARQVSKLRYFARDTGSIDVSGYSGGARDPYAPPGNVRYSPGSQGDPLGAVSAAAEMEQDFGPGVAGWNDFSLAANAARQSLLNAARIEIPDRMFVVWVLSAYLLVLVPANWLVFRALGRVEWAWVAAPVIAILCTAVVIRLAQLDIGFARSQTEISIVEMQPDYPRAHVTRYTALYTALSTTYGIRFDDPGAQVQPFPRKELEARVDPRQRVEEPERKLQYRYGTEVSMQGFFVQSNTTGLLHSEQMVDLGGPISLARTPEGRYRVVNQTGLTLQGAGLIRRNDSGSVETAWIGSLEPNMEVGVVFDAPWKGDARGSFWTRQRDLAALTTSHPSPDELNFLRLVRWAEDPRQEIGHPEELQQLEVPLGQPQRLLGIGPGDVRLVAWLEERIPGLEIGPAAPQSKHATLVIAHLRYGCGEDPQPDQNTRPELEPDRVFRGISGEGED